HLAIDGARLDQPVAEPLLPQLDHETHVHGHAAVQAFVQIGRDGPEEHALHGDVEVVQEDREAGDPEVTLGSGGHRGQTEQKQQQGDQGDHPRARRAGQEARSRHMPDTPLYRPARPRSQRSPTRSRILWRTNSSSKRRLSLRTARFPTTTALSSDPPRASPFFLIVGTSLRKPYVRAAASSSTKAASVTSSETICWPITGCGLSRV